MSVAGFAELHRGVLVASDSSVRAERLRRRLAAAVVAAGRQPRARTMDLLIAATAHAHEARLYPRNSGDLRGLEHPVDVVPV